MWPLTSISRTSRPRGSTRARPSAARSRATLFDFAQDVRALELFAGRTEALRAAVAEEVLPGPQV